jgi:uncharacterized membrane protein YgaE (UPF0421/DUF939 family)
MLMTEAGVSAIIIGSSTPETIGVFPLRPLEGLIGGAVALAVHVLVFPPDPLLRSGRAMNAVVSGLGQALEGVATALRTGDPAAAQRALAAARGVDPAIRALTETLALGRDTARAAPLRRSARQALQRQEEIARHLDYAVRNTRVLARDAARWTRQHGQPVTDLADAVADLAHAVWALDAAFDDPGARSDPRALALRAAVRATEATARHSDLTLIQIAGQIRSTAADLVRAAESAAPQEGDAVEASTEEMLALPRD